MVDNRPADFDQRLQALNPTHSYLCEAPAGSGKTELLTQRFLTLLGGVTKPEELLAITFTRKATAGMRDRIIGALRAGRGPEPAAENIRITWQAAQAALAADERHQWDLLNNPGRLQIQTFDSLCGRLTRALPVHSTFGAPPEITETPEDLYRRAVRELLQSLEQDDGWAEDLGKVLAHLDNNFSALEELCIRLLGRRQEWLPLLDQAAIRSRLEQHLQHVSEDAVARVTLLIPTDCRRALTELAYYAATNLQQQQTASPVLACLQFEGTVDRWPDSDAAGMAQWSGLLELLLTGADQWRSAVDKRIGFPTEGSRTEQPLLRQWKERMTDLIGRLRLVPGVLEALRDLRQAPATRFGDQQMTVLESLQKLLKLLTAHLTVVFSERNCVDFTEMNIRARQALGGLETPTDLALALDYRIRHIMVDEFQDVSTAQVELLRQLTAGWQPGDGHTLFCVGDAMQSIYGFRDSNVGLFIHCKEHGLGHVPLEFISLNTNFRSHGGIVDWINSIFASAFPARNDISSGAVQYAAAVAYDQSMPADSVRVLGFSGVSAAAAEAEAVVEIIRSLRAEQPESSIAILVRNRRDAGHIVPLLRRAAIRYRAVDLEPLAQHMVIQDLLSLCHALLHPADRVAWLSVLRAPWCGLTLADLLIVANTGAGDNLTVTEQLRICAEQAARRSMLSGDGRTRLARVVPVLNQALVTQGRKPLRQWLEGTWLELGGPACLEDPADLVNAEKFFALLETLDEGGGMPELDTMNQAVARLFSAPDPAGDAGLQIMTIHKAKGLEFDAVIVPALHRKPRQSAPELIMWQERLTAGGARELIMAPIPAKDGGADKIYAWLREEQKKREAYETCRLLYVACTRARRRLYLLAQVGRDDETNELRAPPKTSLLHTIWARARPALHVVTPEPAVTFPAIMEKPVRLLRRLPSDWSMPWLPQRDLLAGVIARAAGGSEDTEPGMALDEDPGLDPFARHVGTVVHQALHEIGRVGMASWNANHLDRCRPYWRARLATLGIQAARMELALTEVRAALQSLLEDKNFLWMHSEDHVSRQCEYAISVPARDGYRNLVIDLLLQTRDGQTWIIDYKTGRPAPDGDLDAFIAQRMRLYEPKMTLYRDAVSRLGYAQVRAALYFPYLARLSEYGVIRD